MDRPDVIPRYEIHFRRDAHTVDDRTVIETGIWSLEEARAKRSMSGDLVVDAFTSRVVDDETWLFDWERAQPNCYARRAMKLDNPPRKAA